ncbi:MAG: anti-anti-sigma factor, partial [Desulfuromonadales bacterium]|nr:anti-anti-sigma factor [Desulfuromonadales bacterium]
MNINIDEKGTAVLIEVKEERLDAHNSSELKTQMLSLFDEG